jgi:hypothetical protein
MASALHCSPLTFESSIDQGRLMKTGISGALSALAFALTLGVAIPGWAQDKVGVVTTVIGPVTVARASLPPEPLKFRDDVFLRDRVTTGEDAITRILLGGKVIVTAREHSTLTITETPGLSTIHLTSGRIAVAVEKSRMKPGERVDIRTPNAVAGVRGTVLIVEAQANVSTVTVLRGLVHVTKLNSATGAPVGAFTAVGARQMVTVRNNVLPARSKAITSSRAEELSQEFTPPLKSVAPAAAVVHDSEELKAVLANSAAPLSPAGAPAAAPTAAATPAMAPPAGAWTTAVVATPGAAAAPAVIAAPGFVSSPVPVPVPTPPPAPAIKSPSPPNWGSSWKNVSKDDRSGSNSGKR